MAFSDVYTGVNGTLTLVSSDSPEGADAESVLGSYGLSEAAAVGRVTGIELHVETELEEFHEIGLRHASSLHPGNIHIWGKVHRAYVNGALLYLLMGRGTSPNNIKEPYVQPSFSMNIILDDPANPQIRSMIDLYGVKFENWSFSLPEDDFVLENSRFKALRVNVRDEEGGEVRSPAFAESS